MSIFNNDSFYFYTLTMKYKIWQLQRLIATLFLVSNLLICIPILLWPFQGQAYIITRNERINTLSHLFLVHWGAIYGLKCFPYTIQIDNSNKVYVRGDQIFFGPCWEPLRTEELTVGPHTLRPFAWNHINVGTCCV